MHCAFSIIIPSYNYAEYLPRAVKSCLNQAGDDFEVIVIDDGSKDNTQQIIKPLINSSDNIKLIYQDNKGSAAARNLGVRISNGTYLIFLDADDALMTNALHHYRETVKAYPNKHLIIGGHESIDKIGAVRVRIPDAKLARASRESLFSAYLFKKLSISAGGYAMHRSIFDKLQFPQTLSSTEDIPLYSQTLALFDTVIIQKPIVTIYKHDDSLRHNFAKAHAVGTDIIDVLFDDDILPANFMAYKQPYALKRYLSLAGLAYRAGAYSLARKWYLSAVKFDKRALLKLSKLKLFILSLVKKDTA